MSRRAWATSILVVACCWAVPGRAFEALFDRAKPDASLARLFPNYDTHADVEDGFLLGTGREQLTHLADGRLRIERTRHYTRIRHPDKHVVATLPQPWDMSSTLIVEPTLRLVRVDTQLHFSRSGDTLFRDYKLSEHQPWLFEADRTTVTAIDSGRRLQADSFRAGKLQKRERYDYPPHATPLELVGLHLSVAVQQHIDRFDFDLLVPGGGVHGVRAQIHWTRDVRRWAAGYRVPPQRLIAPEQLALVDMRLASPFKYLFFPHHFYMAFSAREPSKLLMMWGGDPDQNLQAFRTN